MDTIRLARPVAPLREFVRFYAHREVRTGEIPVIHPVPARAFPILEFVFGDRLHVMYEDGRPEATSPRAVLIGAQTHFHSRLKFKGAIQCFVVLFQPAGLHRLFSIPMQDLTDHGYDAHSVLVASVSDLEQRIGECATFFERVRAADAWLLQRACGACSVERISTAAAQLLCALGNARVSD